MKKVKDKAILFKEAERAANSLVQFIGIDKLEPPVNINLILRFFNKKLLPVETEKFYNKNYAYISKTIDDKWKIKIDENLPIEKQRMALFHEIKHMLEDEPMSDSYEEQRELQDFVADQFAEALAMPREMFLRYWKKYRDIEVIARKFCVPTESVENRLRVLEL